MKQYDAAAQAGKYPIPQRRRGGGIIPRFGEIAGGPFRRTGGGCGRALAGSNAARRREGQWDEQARGKSVLGREKRGRIGGLGRIEVGYVAELSAGWRAGRQRGESDFGPSASVSVGILGRIALGDFERVQSAKDREHAHGNAGRGSQRESLRAGGLWVERLVRRRL